MCRATPFEKDVLVLDCVQRRPTKLMERLASVSCKEWLMTLDWPHLLKRRLRLPSSLYRFLMKGSGEGGAELFSLGFIISRCGNGSKLH